MDLPLLGLLNPMDRFPAVIRVLTDISDEKSPARAVEAPGQLCQINISFIAPLSVFKKILNDAKFLSDMLQLPRIDLCSATNLIQTLRQTFEEYRNKE